MEQVARALNPVYVPPQHSEFALELQQAHVFFRHGDRSPTPMRNSTVNPDIWARRLQELPPLLPLGNYREQEHPWGHLTRKGREQALELGRWLNANYSEPLKIPNDPSFEDSVPTLSSGAPTIKVRSTNYLRTHLTAWYVLEGLLGSSYAAAATPITMLTEKEENLYHNDSCPRLAKAWRAVLRGLFDSVKQSDGTYKEMGEYARFEKLKEAISRHLGLPRDIRFPWILGVDAVECGRFHGDPLPESVTGSDIDATLDLFVRHYVLSFQDRLILSLGMGRIIREITDAMRQKASFQIGTALFLYSGHDATLVPLSVALNAPLQHWPGYTANICVELWKGVGASESFVRVLYNGEERPLTMFSRPEEGPKSLLTLDEFIELASYSSITEEEYSYYCNESLEM